MEVKLENISKTYDSNIYAVNNISNIFESEKFTVLLGPSGCGKTTVLRMIAGLEKISKGKLYLGNELANDIPPKKRNIAMAFQRFTMYPGMNVYENIAFPLEIKKIDKTQIKEKIYDLSKILKILYEERKMLLMLVMSFKVSMIIYLLISKMILVLNICQIKAICLLYAMMILCKRWILLYLGKTKK